ncbi:hypothetical protein J4558_26670 [Leptolyngbya sp. 15MV]|nr:hypothetical protein J4558_26670 [Leptolyngbya sp. 15MV]
MGELLRVEGLTKSFGGLRVVEDVTFALESSRCGARCRAARCGRRPR